MLGPKGDRNFIKGRVPEFLSVCMSHDWNSSVPISFSL